MVAVARGAALGASNPLLAEYIAIDGKLVEPWALGFSIHDISTGAKEDDPVLIEGPTDVDLTADLVSAGRYAATWTVPADATLGRYQIVWTAQLVEDGPLLTWRREFEVVATVAADVGGAYILAADMRREGVTPEQASNADLRRRIAEACAYIDKFTGLWFEPRPRTYKLDGTGRDGLFLPDPVVAVLRITQGTTMLSPSAFKVYGAASSPNDRFAPRIMRLSALDGSPLVPSWTWASAGYTVTAVWPRLRQNVALEAIAGYLEPDGSPTGRTPLLIQKACKLLVIRNLPKLADTEEVLAAKNAHRVISEKTREQSYDLARGGGATGDGRDAPFTGDPEIDVLLEAFSRPPYVGFAAV